MSNLYWELKGGTRRLRFCNIITQLFPRSMIVNLEDTAYYKVKQVRCKSDSKESPKSIPSAFSEFGIVNRTIREVGVWPSPIWLITIFPTVLVT